MDVHMDMSLSLLSLPVPSGIAEKFGQLEDYIEGSPLVRKIFETEDGSSEKAYITSTTLERFCLGAHPSLLWPAYMMHRQVIRSRCQSPSN